jgi:hypothetical protein
MDALVEAELSRGGVPDHGVGLGGCRGRGLRFFYLNFSLRFFGLGLHRLHYHGGNEREGCEAKFVSPTGHYISPGKFWMDAERYFKCDAS